MEEFLWAEKYRPKTVQDTILSVRYKEQFQAMVDAKQIPNLILSGSHGIGKTTIAKAMASEIGATAMFINASLDGGKDTLRSDLRDFSTSMTFDGSRKVIILDEADAMTHHMQPALRTFMEQYSRNVSFILTCNHPYNIIPEIHSRCSHIELKLSNTDKKDIAKQMFVALTNILHKEGIEYDKNVLAKIVKKKFPDMRNMIMELQRYSIKGAIDSGIFTQFEDVSMKRLIEAMKKKSLDEIRNWINTNNQDEHQIYAYIYDHVKELMADPDSEANLILTLADYQDKATRAVNSEINLAACLIEISANVKWKD